MEATLLLEKEFPFSFNCVAVEPSSNKIMVGCGDGKIRVINGDGNVCLSLASPSLYSPHASYT